MRGVPFPIHLKRNEIFKSLSFFNILDIGLPIFSKIGNETLYIIDATKERLNGLFFFSKNNILDTLHYFRINPYSNIVFQNLSFKDPQDDFSKFSDMPKDLHLSTILLSVQYDHPYSLKK